MAIRTIEELKTLFAFGTQPDQFAFEDLIDTMFNTGVIVPPTFQADSAVASFGTGPSTTGFSVTADQQTKLTATVIRFDTLPGRGQGALMANGSQMIAPAGFTKVRVGFSCRVSSTNQALHLHAELRKNDVWDETLPVVESVDGTTSLAFGRSLEAWTPVLTVTPGDEFSVYFTSNISTTVNGYITMETVK